MESSWPSCDIKGCRFRLGQAWHRKIQKLGLSTTYKSASAEGSYLRSFFGLCFLSPDHVEDFFLEEFAADEPDNSAVRTFSDYIFDTYISSNARFPPTLWAQYTETVCRTTNACEALHGRMKDMFYHAHPSIYIFINALLEIQGRVYIKMNSISSTKKLKKSAEKERFIRDAMDQFENDEISRREYVKIVSRKFLPNRV